jgi:hypothetical protein
MMESEILSPRSLFLIQFTATAMMTGLIWFVQVVHYPLFARIPEEGFTAYERSHANRTGWVVAPIMLVEFAAAMLPLALKLPLAPGRTAGTDPLYLSAVGCLLLIWASTFLLQVPLHRILERRHDKQAILLLTATNWIRTLLWSLRLAMLAMLFTRCAFA